MLWQRPWRFSVPVEVGDFAGNAAARRIEFQCLYLKMLGWVGHWVLRNPAPLKLGRARRHVLVALSRHWVLRNPAPLKLPAREGQTRDPIRHWVLRNPAPLKQPSSFEHRRKFVARSLGSSEPGSIEASSAKSSTALTPCCHWVLRNPAPLKPCTAPTPPLSTPSSLGSSEPGSIEARGRAASRAIWSLSLGSSEPGSIEAVSVV